MKSFSSRTRIKLSDFWLRRLAREARRQFLSKKVRISSSKPTMELQVGVKILLKNEDGNYLLIRRSPEKYPEIGAKWDIIGTRMEPGVSLLDNLII